VNSRYLIPNNINCINLSQHEMMHRKRFYKKLCAVLEQKIRSMQRPRWMKCWQVNPMSYEYKRFIQSILQWRIRCTGLKKLQ
jgi:hypothetical protein